MQMKSSAIILILITSCTFCKAQDGSDIRYYAASALDSSFVGKEVYLDFYRRSFMGINTDTIVIKINSNPVRFIERRKDDGFNNWFSQQALEAIDSLYGIAIKITSWTILGTTKESVLVKPNYSLYLPKETWICNRLLKEDYWFNKTIIKEVLVQSK